MDTGDFCSFYPHSSPNGGRITDVCDISLCLNVTCFVIGYGGKKILDLQSSYCLARSKRGGIDIHFVTFAGKRFCSGD
jgi:hypothetical protein